MRAVVTVAIDRRELCTRESARQYRSGEDVAYEPPDPFDRGLDPLARLQAPAPESRFQHSEEGAAVRCRRREKLLGGAVAQAHFPCSRSRPVGRNLSAVVRPPYH